MGHGAPELAEFSAIKPKLSRAMWRWWASAIWMRSERRLIKDSGVHVFTMRDIDERGMRDVMNEALRFVTDDTDGVASASIWTLSTRATRRASVLRCAAE